ncbi:MAG: bifunctional metallophosphatase/5'-nucleotidase, partial [Flavobacteriaceae bacterium]|nr:bifunctional metallophosphatase/5'-nucleotidase [Flavobacteriaceae bacterium]
MKWTRLSLVLLLFMGCKSTKQIPIQKEDGLISFKFVQLNDVYEIAPLSGGKYGGMARVAYVVDSIKKVEPN